LKAPERFAGKTVKCPRCAAPIRVPTAPDGAPLSVPLPAPAEEDAYGLRDETPRPSDDGGHVSEPVIVAQPVAEVPPLLTTIDTSVPRRPRPRSQPKFARPPAAGKGLLYLLFALTLLPLAVSLFAADDDLEQRIERTVENLPDAPDLDDPKLTLDGFLARLPDGRIEGAHLPRATWTHWLYALLATAGFLAAVYGLFDRGDAVFWQVLLVIGSMATFGILFLLAVQWIAAFTQGYIVTGGSLLTLLFYIFKFIGFSYSAAMDPSCGFWMSFLGYTCGVGFCEEFTKTLPIALHYRGDGRMDWRGACLWGLASGIGFGVAEGIMYSSQYYNGLSTGGIYLVRFISCVGLHSIWGASCAVAVFRNKSLFESEWDWSSMGDIMLNVLAVPMVLHGLYDTLLKKEMELAALAVAAASFVWLIVLIERTRSGERAFFAAAGPAAA
jgi:RsiW-degrading membrane proteinase PrsW (M82 family)